MQSIFPKQCTTKINLIHTEWDSWSLTFSVNNVFEKQRTICLNQLQIHHSCGTKVTTSGVKNMQENKHSSLIPLTNRAVKIIIYISYGSSNQQQRAAKDGGQGLLMIIAWKHSNPFLPGFLQLHEFFFPLATKGIQ